MSEQQPKYRVTRRADLEGEMLAPEPGRELTPWLPSGAPRISIRLPQADDDALLTWEKRTIQRPVTVESDVLVPGAQAMLTALAAGIVAGLLAWAIGWNWRVPVVAFGVAVASAWLWRLRLADELLWATETLTGRDVNRDGAVGRPATFALVNPAQAHREASRAVATTASEAAKAELLAFVHRCYTTGCSEIAHGVNASGPDRQAYIRQRDVLFSLGIATWRHAARPKAGWKMAVSHQRAVDLIGRHVL